MDANQHMFKGKLHELKGQARQTFAKLTNVERLSGKLEEFSGSLQQVYGYTRATAGKAIGALVKRRR